MCIRDRSKIYPKFFSYYFQSDETKASYKERSHGTTTVSYTHLNALTEQAVSRAAQASAVPEDIRRKRAVVAASKRHVSEAETRYLIDEQLRKVGWEADSETLRHSFGTRPQVGRNLAIAEWPTDSSVGNRGFADYALFAGTRLVGIIEAKACLL